MAQPESALRAWALADPTLAGLIGTRFYPMDLPQTPTLPACTYFRVSRAKKDEIPYSTVRIQVTCWATTHDGARALADAFIAAATARKGTSAGCDVKYASLANETTMHDAQTGYYAVPVDVKVTYKEG